MARVLGIDYGSARVGLALSDPLGFTAGGYLTLDNKRKPQEVLLAELAAIVKEQDVNEIVVGLPKRTDGRLSESETAARNFGSALELAVGIKVHFFDERFTTVMAHRILNAGSKKRDSREKRQVVDQVAAEIILQNYLESKRLA